MMDVEALSEALHTATETVDTPPDFAQKVHRGARRRLVRRRYRIGVVVLVVLAIGTGLTAFSDRWVPVVTGSHSGPDSAQPPSDDPRLHSTAGGDLVTDQTFLVQVRTAWQHGLVPGTAPVGSINVYWAGDTPAGPAAVVLQGARASTGAVVEIGLVTSDPRTHQLALRIQQTVGTDVDGQTSDSFAFGTADATVLTMAESGFGVYSPSPTVDPNTGKVTRRWTDLPYVDGVAVFDVTGAGGNGRTVVELPQRPDARSTPPPLAQQARYQPMLVGGSTQGAADASPPDPRMRWPSLLAKGIDTPPTPDYWNKVFDKALHGGGYADPYVRHPVDDPAITTSPSDENWLAGESYWQIVVALPSGDTVDLGEELVGSVGRLYAITVDSQRRVLGVGYGGPIDPNDPLPVRYRLPQGQGWILGAYGAGISGPAQSGNGILLVPAGTTTVTVTPPSGQPRTIELHP
jgi:hypothetical protein